MKTSDGGLRDWSWKYSWYSSNSATNGGNSGGTGGIASCNGTLPGGLCNTEALVTAVNAAALCSYTDWRLPTYRELFSLVHFGVHDPSIDTSYFPIRERRTRGPLRRTSRVRRGRGSFGFSSGYAINSTKTAANFVRLVRGGQF